MDFHGITMKGKYYMEEVTSPTASVSHVRRVVYNTSSNANGSSDQFGQFKMYYHNNTQWVRPLLGNVNDGPDIDNARFLGTASYRFAGIYARNFYGTNFYGTNFYGTVRYS